jgi:hypothetical protein
MNKGILFVFLILSGLRMIAQENSGSLQIIEDPRIDTLVKRHFELNKINPCIEGWRINIFFEAGNYSKKLAIEAKSHFVQNHPDIPCYLVFQEPYYKIRIGDFRTKLQAAKVLKEISPEYPNAFVIEDDINFPAL